MNGAQLLLSLDRSASLAQNAASHVAYFTVRASEELRANRPSNATAYTQLVDTFRRMAARSADRALPSEVAEIDALGQQIEQQPEADTMSVGNNWTPGPNFGRRGDKMPPLAIRRMPKRSAANSEAVAPTPATPDAAERMTLQQIVSAYAREHNENAPGGSCACQPCVDLRWHVRQARAMTAEGTTR